MSEGSHLETSYHNEPISQEPHLKDSEAYESSDREGERGEEKGRINHPLDLESVLTNVTNVTEGFDPNVDKEISIMNYEDLLNCNVQGEPSSPVLNNNTSHESNNYVTLFDRYIKKVTSSEITPGDSAGQHEAGVPADAGDPDFTADESVSESPSLLDVEMIPNRSTEDVVQDVIETNNCKSSTCNDNLQDVISSGDAKTVNPTGANDVFEHLVSDGPQCEYESKEEITYYLKRVSASATPTESKDNNNVDSKRETKRFESDVSDNVDNNDNQDKREKTVVTDNRNIFFPVRKSESIPNINENSSGNDSDPLISKKDNFRPIYRLSMRLSQSVFGNVEIPNADTHRQYDKAGYLLKLSGRGFPYLHQWKRRYCVLTKSALYVYEKETSRGCEKNSFVVDLKYFDHVAEAMQKETKKASNVFVITSQDRSFFDPGRHLFSADTLTEMHEWISKLKEAVELIRNNNRPTAKSAAVPIAEDKMLKDIRQSLNQRRRSKDGGTEGDYSKQAALLHVDEDTVDSKTKDTDKMNEELLASLEKKRKRESTHRRSRIGTEKDEYADKEENKKEDEEEEEVKVPRKKSSTKKVTLQAPNSEEDSKPLESITKHRNKGPMGRRAPQSRRTVLMKQRASSMSALQHGGPNDDSARNSNNWVNVSADVLEEGNSQQDSGSLNTSQSALAYRYSSDEDSLSDEAKDSEDYFQSPPPVLASYNIPEVLHKPVEGLRVYVPSTELRNACDRGGSPPLEEREKNQELLEYRSLPRQLRKSSSTLRESPLTKTPALGRASSSKLSSGRASPEMDALDNLLMSQSVGTSTGVVPIDATSDIEGSDVSTCKGPQHTENDAVARSYSEKNIAKTLHGFSDTLQHLQHHTAELEMRTKLVEGEVFVSRKDYAKLLESSRNLQSDVEQLAKAVSVITHETSAAHKLIISQRQETEQVQKVASSALAEAKRAQVEYEKAKGNYECLIKELHSLVTSIRTSLVVTDREEDPPLQQTSETKTEVEKKENEERAKTTNKENESKRPPNKDYSKMSGYQSFFQRPSSLIYSLSYKTTNKGSSTSEENKTKKEEKKSHPKKDPEEKKNAKSSEGSLEKKLKREKSSQNSLEKKSKSSKKGASQSEASVVVSDLKVKETPSSPKFSNEVKVTGKKLSKLSFENIPMMDEHSDHLAVKESNVSVGVSHVKINVSPPTQNFQIEKSLSSPSVTVKGLSSRPCHPNSLSISQNNKDWITPQSSTDSSPTGSAPTSMGSEMPVYNSNRDLRYPNEASLFPACPPISSHVRATFRTPQEERTVSQTRPGIFAISRQSSFPNIPVQRQNSGTLFPLQRQHSLGTVPEEGQLPRQASLRSVPEERPIVDQTLPLSPSPSMVSFSLSPSPSAGGLDSFRERNTYRNSMELLTGPVISGSHIQESYIRQLPPPAEFDLGGEYPMATSSLKRTGDRKKNSRVVHV